MKPCTLLLVTGATVLAIGSAALAQSPRAMLREIDTNQDQLIQFSELQSFRARTFDRFDTNGDGIADADEVAALRARAEGSGRRGPINMEPGAADANGDGVITRSEFASYLPERTLNADRNGDGALSRSELRALR